MQKWQVVGTSPLVWREWNNQFVVYHPPSGDTHLLTAVAASVLRALESAPRSMKELVRTALSHSNDQTDHPLLMQIEDLIDTLERKGVIEKTAE